MIRTIYRTALEAVAVMMLLASCEEALVSPEVEPPPAEPAAPAQRGLGLRLLDVEAYRSAPIIRADPVAVPSFIDISVDVPRPGDQGSQGSCVGWAVAYTLKTYHERIERGWPLTDNRHVMSPAYVYNQIKQPGGGAFYADAFRLLAHQGVSSWAAMPYDWRDDRSQPSAGARAEAADYKIADWGTVLRNTHAVFVQEVKRHLAAGTPVLIAVPVHPDFEYLSESNPVYDDGTGTKRGYHAVVIVGYDDRRSAFKVANSWGTEWGIGGYGWIDYAASERLIRSAYVTKDAGPEPEPEPESENKPPTVGDHFIEVDLVVGFTWTHDAAWHDFSDPEGQALTYSVAAAPPGIVTVSYAPDEPGGWVFTITAVAPGDAIITITATDSGGLSASAEVLVTVYLHEIPPSDPGKPGEPGPGVIPMPPYVIAAFPLVQLVEDGKTATVDVAPHFSDPEGQSLTYAVAVDPPEGVVAIGMARSMLTIAPVAPGEATITVTAVDPDGLSASTEVEVTVYLADPGESRRSSLKPERPRQ